MICETSILEKNTDTNKVRVAIYDRIKLNEPESALIVSLREEKYVSILSKHPEWLLVGKYIDEKRPATFIEQRPEFSRMKEDCNNGNIDLIVVLKISALIRNMFKCMDIIKEFQSLQPPVHFYFDDLGISTADNNGKLISFVCTVAAKNQAIISSWSNPSAYETASKYDDEWWRNLDLNDISSTNSER
ncbi:recombinase family protein [Butyrivibrio sp. INlla16]|uniref:recombinase family protein n=1 Tax=Butyrivibrio sp. INlla16 TaxID=1520807 RepID=UPI000887495E|nr:recombinase family protein [Butyrivibrio sp. INlla16]SDB52082.1 Resolvase, N terminal domain [Butyrivibrio sp. INlla16]